MTLLDILIFAPAEAEEPVEDEEPVEGTVALELSTNLQELESLLSSPADVTISLPLLNQVKLAFYSSIKSNNNNKPLLSLFKNIMAYQEADCKLWTYASIRLQGKGY